jgi:hypothetical protein
MALFCRCVAAVALSVFSLQLGCGGGGNGGGGGGGGGAGGGGGGGATGPTITAQPQNQSVTVGQSATFNVSAAGNGSLTYQWRKNGTAIAGATASSLTFTAELADSGSSYQVAVSDPQGTVTSNSATLAVMPVSFIAFALAKESSFGLASDGTLYGWGPGWRSPVDRFRLRSPPSSPASSSLPSAPCTSTSVG